MDPKSFAGKSPPLETLDAAFASKLSSWVHRDMLRAKKAREEKQKKAEAAQREGHPAASPKPR